MKNLKVTLYLCLAASAFAATSAMAKEVNVFSGTQLQEAIKNAEPGDDIILHPADYGDASFENSGDLAAYFYLSRSGTAKKPITIRSRSRRNMQTLYGSGPNGHNNNYVMYVTGDHWRIKNLIIRTGKKGVMMDGANHNVFDNVEVYDTGDEAFHFRKSSSNNVLKNCWIHDSGKIPGREGYGEGVYVGSHNGDTLEDYSNNNTIAGCIIGPNVTAEPIEIKEATENTLVEGNWIIGNAVSGENYADSFIDVKGNGAIIRRNRFTDAGNSTVSRGIHFLNKKTHLESWVYFNFANMEPSAEFMKIGEGLVHQSWNRKMDGSDNIATTYSTGAYDEEINWREQPRMRFYRGFTGVRRMELIRDYFIFEREVDEPSDDSDNCLVYTSDDRAELDLSTTTCVDLSIDLDGRTLQVWDSDTNTSCDFRGVVESIDGSGSVAVDGNYVTSTTMTGQKIRFQANNGCQFVKMRIY